MRNEGKCVQQKDFPQPFCFPFDKVYYKVLCSKEPVVRYEFGFLCSQSSSRLASRIIPFPLCSAEHS